MAWPVARLARYTLLVAIGLSALPATARLSPFLYAGGQVTRLRVQGIDVIDVDINDRGLIGGSYFAGPDHVRGYLYDNGQLSTFAVPGASSTSVADINNLGTVAGNYSNGYDGDRGYVYAGGSFTAVAVPGAVNTYIRSINDAGSVGGFFYDSSGTARGFIKTGIAYDVIDVPGAFSTYLIDINASGQATGYSVGFAPGSNAVVLKSFIYSGGTVTDLDDPAGIDGGSIAAAINDQGDLTGDYIAAQQRRAFLYSGGTFIGLGNAANNETFGVDINNAGMVIGYSRTLSEAFVYANGGYLFLTSPSGEGIRFDAINNAGAIVGLYGFASNGLPEPQVWLMLLLGFGATGLAMRRRPAAAALNSSPPRA